ncbi:MAG: hypothetical protein ACOX6W_14495, partial [Lentisphaeria bacterium]
EIVNHNTQEQLIEIVKLIFSSFEKAVDKSRTIQYIENTNDTKGEWKFELKPHLNFSLISDSILIWTEDDEFRTFRNLLEVISELLLYGIKNGFPLRGAMTYGEIIVHKDDKKDPRQFFTNEAIYGKAVIEAISLEKIQEWSGCVISPSAWGKICEKWCRIITGYDDSNAYFNKSPLLTWYPIPLKNGSQPGIAINWNSTLLYKKEIINSYVVKNSFYSHGKGFIDKNRKLDETLGFLDYTTQLLNYCFGLSASDFLEQKKTIPTPGEHFATQTWPA